MRRQLTPASSLNQSGHLFKPILGKITHVFAISINQDDIKQ